ALPGVRRQPVHAGRHGVPRLGTAQVAPDAGRSLAAYSSPLAPRPSPLAPRPSHRAHSHRLKPARSRWPRGRTSRRQPVQGIEAARAATAHYDDPDVVIVGAGASGAAVAWSLASAGFKVVTIEQGDWVNPQTLSHFQRDWEPHRLTDFNADPNVRGRLE